MKKQGIFFIWIVFIFLFEIGIAILPQKAEERHTEQFTAEEGVVDVGSWEYKERGRCHLQGEWMEKEGTTEKLVNLPENLLKGTTHKRSVEIYLKNLPKNQQLYVSLNKHFQFCRVEFNGKLIDKLHPIDTEDVTSGQLKITFKSSNITFMNTTPALYTNTFYVNMFGRMVAYFTVSLVVAFVASFLLASIFGNRFGLWKTLAIILLWDIGFLVGRTSYDLTIFYDMMPRIGILTDMLKIFSGSGSLVVMAVAAHIPQIVRGRTEPGPGERGLVAGGIIAQLILGLIVSFTGNIPSAAGFALMLVQIGINVYLGIWMLWKHKRSMEKYGSTFNALDAAFYMIAIDEMLHACYLLGVFEIHSSTIAVFGSLLLYTFVICIYFRQARMMQEEKERREELEVLVSVKQSRLGLAQIQPHFLYNSLSAIRYLIKKDEDQAVEAVDALTVYLRGHANGVGNEELISLTECMKAMDGYLYMQKLRFGDRVEIRKKIECSDFMLPPLTIVTLVENSVKYGLRDVEEGGLLCIHVYREDANYYVVVEDNGCGFDTAILEHSEGIGIPNVRYRLEVMVKGRLEIESAPGQGTRAVVVIPAGAEA